MAMRAQVTTAHLLRTTPASSLLRSVRLEQTRLASMHDLMRATKRRRLDARHATSRSRHGRARSRRARRLRRPACPARSRWVCWALTICPCLETPKLLTVPIRSRTSTRRSDAIFHGWEHARETFKVRATSERRRQHRRAPDGLTKYGQVVFQNPEDDRQAAK